MKPTDLNQFHPQPKRRWIVIDWEAFWIVLTVMAILFLAWAWAMESDSAAAAGIAASTANIRADTVEKLLAHCANGQAVGLGGDAVMTCRIVGMM